MHTSRTIKLTCLPLAALTCAAACGTGPSGPVGEVAPSTPARSATNNLLPPQATPALQKAGVREMVATFTTNFDKKDPTSRHNARRGAALLNGTVVKPGAMFSFNEKVGPRTTKRGFVPAPTVVGDHLENTPGGGICQLSATLFNSVYLAGLKITQAKAHSMYFPEYPKGREAAVSYPGLDLRWKNDTPTPLLITTSSSDASLTVNLWGTSRYQVRTAASKPRNRVRPPSRKFRKGSKCVASAGYEGFDITVARTVTRKGRVVRRERTTTHYVPQPKVRCV